MLVFENLKHLFALIYIIPSLLLYLITLYIIFFSSNKHQFSSSFYWIFGFSGINYILHSMTYYFMFRLSATPIFHSFYQDLPPESFIYPIIYAISYYSLSATNGYSLAISFNRFTVFLLKTKYTNFWDRYLNLILCLCVFGPIILIWNIPFIGIKNIIPPFSNTVFYLQPSITDFMAWWNLSRNSSIVLSITALLSFGMNLYVIYSVIKRKYSQNSVQDSSMIAYSLLIFVTQIISFVQFSVLAINREFFLQYVLITQPWISDIIDFAPIWFVLLTNKLLRKEIKNKLHFLCNKKVAPLQTVTTQQSIAESAFNEFRDFYYNKYSGRVLTVNPNYGFADLKATFYKKDTDGSIREETKILTVTTLQMCILMKFNESESFTFKKLLDDTKICDRDLRRALESMAMGKESQRILARIGNGETEISRSS